MSLLEDIYLQDEANEAQELERVIEGDEYDERPRSVASNSDENSAKEDEAEEDKRRVDPKSDKPKRIIKNPRFLLNPARLTGPRGIQVIPDHFKDFKFKGKGHEKEDLDMLLKKLEHWAYRLYPKFGFEDCLKKIETLGKKKPVMVHLHKIRSDQFQSEEMVVQKDSSDDEESAPPAEEDEFDKLLQQQIELARAAPAPDSVRKPGAATPRHINMSPFAMPKATSSPSISDEQRERMLRNRKLAEERRLARLKQNTSNDKPPEVATVRLNTLQERISNANDNSSSSDEEVSMTAINHSVTVEVNAVTDKETAVAKYTDKDITENGNKSNDLDTEIKQSKITENDVELSETYTQQQSETLKDQATVENCTEPEPFSETYTEEQYESQTYTEQQSEPPKDQATAENCTEPEPYSETYTEQRYESQTYTEQQFSETYTEPQNMEIGSEDLVGGKDKELRHLGNTKKEHIEQQNEKSMRSPEVSKHIEVLDDVDTENIIVSKDEKTTKPVEDNSDKTDARTNDVEKDESSVNIVKDNNTKIIENQNQSEIEKNFEEDLMDVDFDDDF